MVPTKRSFSFRGQIRRTADVSRVGRLLMIEPWIAHELHEIERRLCEDDRRFVDGFRRGRPRQPREYRRRSRWWLISAASAAATVAALWIASVTHLVTVLSAALSIAAITFAALGCVVVAVTRRRWRRRRPRPGGG
jgi:Flp pilus assembly protein TadB